MAEEEAEGANAEQRGTLPTSPSKRIKLAAHESANAEEEEEEAPVIRREAPSPAAAASPPQYLPRKLCKRFSTPQGCPFGNSCRFTHRPGSEHFLPRFVHNYNACTKFISALGCPYGERCHFWHCWPKGVAARVDTDWGNTASTSNADRCIVMPEIRERREEYKKTRLCMWFGSATRCRYGEKCHFAHGEEEVNRSEGAISRGMHVYSPGSSDLVKGDHVNEEVKMEENKEKKDSLDVPPCPNPVRLVRQPTQMGARAFGRSTKSMISIDANLAGPIIGTSGMHTKHIRRLTGAKVLIREHESDPNLRVVEVEGSFEQVKQASVMVREVLYHALRRPPLFYTHSHKSKVCEKFPQGLCRFGNQCRFVHAGRQEAHTKPSCTEA